MYNNSASIQHKTKTYAHRFSMGAKIEDEFYNFITQNKKGLNIDYATKEQNIMHRFDFMLEQKSTGATFTVDVKNKKNMATGYNTEDITWCEIVNCEGYAGWLYAVNLNFIAIKIKYNEWLIVNRVDLANLVNLKLEDPDLKIFYNNEKEKMIDHVYTRKNWGWQDKLMMLRISDIKNFCKHSIWTA